MKWNEWNDLPKHEVNVIVAFKEMKASAGVTVRDGRGIPKLLWSRQVHASSPTKA